MRQWLGALPLPCYAPEGAEGSSSASPAGETDAGQGGSAAGQDSTAPGSEESGAPPSEGRAGDGEDEEPRRGGKDAKPGTLMDAIKASVAKDTADPSSGPAKTGKDALTPEGKDPAQAKPGEKPGETGGDQKPAGKDGKNATPDFHKHPDFLRVVGERDSFKADAENHRSVQRYMDENGLSNEDVADGLQLMAMLHNDPEAAHKELTQLLAVVDTMLGNTLPKDLQDQVDTGAITEAAAKEVSRARAGKVRADQKAARAEKDRESTETQRAFQEKVTEIQGKVKTWEEAKAKVDPDFAKKRGQVGINVRAILQQRNSGYKDGEDAVAVLERAYEMVNSTIATFAPKPQARRGSLGSGGSHVVKTPAAPAKSLREAIDNSIGYSK